MEMSATKNKEGTQDNALIAELEITVLRYQAYLDEVSANTIQSEFLDDFKILPTTYYHPDSPALFQDFIDRWGTHIVKSASFGGKLTFTRTATNDGTVDLNDFHQETQKEFEEMTAASFAHEDTTQETTTTDLQVSGAASDQQSGASASGHGGRATSDQSTETNTRGNSDTDAETNVTSGGTNDVDQEQTQTSFDDTIISAEGGSQKVAALLGDLYSPSFKGTLKRWLESIPEYPKPFGMTFVPLPEVLTHLLKGFLDEECVEQCASHTIQFTDDKDIVHLQDNLQDSQLEENSGSDFCIKEQTNSFNCKDPEVYLWDQCHRQCEADLPTCQISEEIKRPCSLLKLEEEKWRRRVQALDTAIDIYIENQFAGRGGLVQQQDLFIRGGAPLCTIAYEPGFRRDFDVSDGSLVTADQLPARPVDDWDILATHTIMIRFDMRSDIRFRSFPANLRHEEPLLNIDRTGRWFLRFDGFHRKWYTQSSVAQNVELPMLDSAQYVGNDLKNTEVKSRNGVGIHINQYIIFFYSKTMGKISI